MTAILAYQRTKYYFYTYYVLTTLTDMVCQGSINCLTLAYVADNIPESQRASAFGLLSGITSASFVFGTLTARFLPTSATFQVSASIAAIATIYMKTLLPDSNSSSNIRDDASCSKSSIRRPLKYYLKARFHFGKDQFADLLLMSGVAAAISQVPYVAAMFSIMFCVINPCIRSIVSKQVGPDDQVATVLVDLQYHKLYMIIICQAMFLLPSKPNPHRWETAYDDDDDDDDDVLASIDTL
ncbi:hypothetical protein ACLOJK_016574 [Asimina triloba]